MGARTGVTWSVKLLGGFNIKTADGHDVTPPGRKLRALISCLCLPPEQGWSRERLAALLWGDRDDEQARACLRQALAELRRILGEPCPVQADRETVALDTSTISVDAVEFRQLAAADLLKEAADLYRGDLLDGVSLPDAGFADWLAVNRMQFQDMAIDVLTRLSAAQTGEAAIGSAQRVLQLDPLHEGAHRALMQLYTAGGQRGLALRQYQICCDRLKRDLSVKPEPATEQLFRQLQVFRSRWSVAPWSVHQLNEPPPADSVLPLQERAGAASKDVGPLSITQQGTMREVSWLWPLTSIGSTILILVSIALIVLVGAATIGRLEHEKITPKLPRIVQTPEAALGLPVVLILPFQYLTGDPAKENLGLGVAADMSDLLWNSPEFQVMSGSSTGITGNDAAHVDEISKKYGAQFIIGGAIRRSGEVVVVTAQLIDGATGINLWSGRFETPASDMVQVEKAAARKFSELLGGMTGKMQQAYERIAWSKSEIELTEYDYYARGHAHHHRFKKEELLIARQIYEAGLKRYPNSILLRAKLSLSYVTGIYRGWDGDVYEAAAKIRKYAKEAAALLAAGGRTRLEESHVYWASAYAQHTRRDFRRCISDAEAAVALSPYDPFLRADLANIVAECGEPEVGIEWSMEAMRQEPTGIPNLAEFYEASLVRTLYLGDRCPEAIAIIQRMQNPELRIQAACSVRLGQLAEARRTMAEFLIENPGHNLENERMFPVPLSEPLREQWLGDMRMAGMPEYQQSRHLR